MPRLVLHRRGKPPTTHDFEPDHSPIRIGRGADCDVVILDPLVSRKHAQIALTEHGYIVEDLGAPNGVFVEGARIKREMLRDGGTFSVAGYEFVFMVAPRDVKGALPGGKPGARSVAQQAQTLRPMTTHETVGMFRIPGIGAFLERLDGERVVARHSLDRDRVTFGRSGEAVIDVGGAWPIPAVQAAIERVANQRYLVALTKLRAVERDGQRIKERAPLSEGDRIKIGSVEFIYHESAHSAL